MTITKEWVNKKKKELKDKGLPDQLRKITIGGNIYVIRAVTYKEYTDLDAKYVTGNPKIKALENDEEVKRLRDLQTKVSNMIIETLQAKGGMTQKEYEEYMLNPDLLLSGRKDYKANKKVYFIFQDKRKKEEIYKESIKKILDKLCWAIENNKKMIPGIDEAIQSLEAAIKVEKANYFRILN